MTTKTRIQEIRKWFKSQSIYDQKRRAALRRAVLTIYERQTTDEQHYASTTDSNGRGFSAKDAKFGTIMAEKIADLEQGKSPYQDLTLKMYYKIHKMMKKYARQLAEAYEERHALKS